MPPIVASAWRELVPNYTVRDIFSAPSAKKFAQRAAEAITQKLAVDGIVVKEVMLRDIQLPAEYAKGLGDLPAEGTGERSDGRGDGDPAEAGADRGTRGRGQKVRR